MSEPMNPDPQPPTQEDIQADIEATRARLAESVDALAQKADVKARAKEAAEETKQRAADQARQLGERLRRAPRSAQVLIALVPVALVVWVIIRAVRHRGR